MKFDKLKDKSKADLVMDLLNLKKEMFNLRMQKSQGKVEKLLRARECRRDYARVKTKLAQIKTA